MLMHPSMAIHVYPLFGSGRFFSFVNPYTVGRAPWTGDQPVARPLPYTQDSINIDFFKFFYFKSHFNCSLY
jgi:hypothetical protein